MLFWITGNYYEVQKQWKSLCLDIGDYNLEVVDCGNDDRGNSAADIILLLKHKDLFDDRPRIIKMKGIPEDYSLLTDYLHLTNDRDILVVVSPVGYYSSGPGNRFIPASASKFYKKFVSDGKVYKFDMDAGNDGTAVAWCEKVSLDLGKTLERDAGELLVGMKGRNLDILYCEISKLVLYQSSKKITVDDVLECVVETFTQTVWDCAEYLSRRDYDKAIVLLHRFYENAGIASGDTFRGDVEQFLGALFYHFLFVLLLKDGCGECLSYNSAVKAVEGFKKRVKKEDKYFWDSDLYSSGYVGYNIRKPEIQTAVQLNKKQVYTVFLDLCKCRTACRSARSEEEIKYKMDMFALKVCS